MTNKTNISVGFKAEATMMQILASDSLEIIFDLDALPTGNLFVEYQNKKQASGISTSQSDWWVIFLNLSRSIMVRTEKLKVMCRKHIGTDKDVFRGDSKGILLPLKDLLEYDGAEDTEEEDRPTGE
jgi:hypothetical protein|tara:strand:- start:391 stop:768 length:378 start_codon:yes stop_codon:yes gene_type:complete